MSVFRNAFMWPRPVDVTGDGHGLTGRAGEGKPAMSPARGQGAANHEHHAAPSITGAGWGLGVDVAASTVGNAPGLPVRQVLGMFR